MPTPAAFPPLLITFEGIDGSGKSTQVRRLQRRLKDIGAEPLLVREPGGTALSERVRALLLDPAAEIAPRAELLLFAAARAQLVDEAVRPALAAGRPVLADRFCDSTTAYQGAGRGLAEAEWLAGFHRFTTGGLIPDRTFVVDVPLEVAARRRGREADRMEAAGAAFFERVRTGYLALAEREPERVRVLDGTRPIGALADEVWEEVEGLAAAAAGGTARSASG